MAEYISKDDAILLMSLLDEKTYSLTDAKIILSLRDRLKTYIDNPEGEQIKMVGKNTAVLVVEEPKEIEKEEVTPEVVIEKKEVTPEVVQVEQNPE